MPEHAEAKPWQREDRGRYRSADGRFGIEQGDPGRWFLVDEEWRDEFGLARTVGPFSKLDDAKAEAETLRHAAPAVSPLAPKLAAPKRATKTRSTAAAKAAAKAAAAPKRAPEPVRLPTPSWLDELSPDQASHARRSIVAMEKLGIDDAERIVRQDMQTAEPAVAATLLRRFVRARVDEWVAPILPTYAARALAEPIISAVTDATLEAISESERDPSADDGLPGWQLLERPSTPGTQPRRIHLPATRGRS